MVVRPPTPPGLPESSFLYGDLRLKILEARLLSFNPLPNCFTAAGGDVTADEGDVAKTGRDVAKADGDVDCGKLPTDHVSIKIHSQRIKKLSRKSLLRIRISLGAFTLALSRLVKKSRSPHWNEDFNLQIADHYQDLHLDIEEMRGRFSRVIGTLSLAAIDFSSGEIISRWFDFNKANQKSSIYVEYHFTSADSNPFYNRGKHGEYPRRHPVPAYFPLRKGNRIRLYHDAHIPSGSLTPIQLEDNGTCYYTSDDKCCWADMFRSIVAADRLIYILGWSLLHKIKLVREPTNSLPEGFDLSLGELLKKKAREGVRVLILLWKDKTSQDKLFIQWEGIMGTHDKETRKFFKNSDVTCILVSRYGNDSYMIDPKMLFHISATMASSGISSS